MRLQSLAIVVLVACGCLSDKALGASSDTKNSPASLVQAALDAESTRAAEQRQELLARALAADPDFAPARWQSGFVRWHDEWLSSDDVSKRMSDDKTLAAYHKLREQAVDSADGQRSLARWCRKNKLTDEARAHWLKVFEFEPDDAEAQGALGLQLFAGRLLTHDQIAQAKKQAAEQQKAAHHYKPLVTRWRAAFERGTEKQREDAAAELAELSDAAAIPSLQACFKAGATAQKLEPLQLLIIEAAGRMQRQEATALLLDVALLSDQPRVRLAAIAELKKRPTFTFVPQLIAAVPAALKTRFHVMTYGNGQLVRRSETVLEGRDFEYSISHDVIDQPIRLTSNGPALAPNAPQQLQDVATTEIAGGARNDQVAQQYDRWRQAAIARIRSVLEATTGFTDTSDPALWEKQWNDYNGWYNSPYHLRPYRTYAENTYSYTPLYLAPGAVTATRVSTPQPAANPASNPMFFSQVRTHSCFPAGTPVLTLAGLRPIEDIRGGDRVLAQDPQTGELSYRTVQDTTLRSPMPLVKLSMGSETIRATRGHPFWVVGAGWRVAKFLKIGDRLHGIDGAVAIDAIEEERPSEVYNLVVSDCHNYFVGRQRLLVHDNSSLEAVNVPVPGAQEFAAEP